MLADNTDDKNFYKHQSKLSKYFVFTNCSVLADGFLKS